MDIRKKPKNQDDKKKIKMIPNMTWKKKIKELLRFRNKVTSRKKLLVQNKIKIK